ncbi:MBOAT family O-acyltransferase [Chitinophaga nivalis]|uniref:MBOAT family protein n=1 Tax=Chitinophaga nivalis TaxID=2991709 RepID=A0ABT3IWQ3_9BACT|nr:MBOAT family O-acyltransferase [Chitinophaga nivalis]MCW3461925.1 MBOAT family protein [Chitinophaga nivalis]MCW3488384.1 MBOAT family protein [Chitinophaga nivalis]
MINTDKLISELLYNPADPVLFNSAFFFYFFALFLFCYLAVNGSKTGRVWVYTIFSLYFFYKACGFYVGLVVLSAIVDFNLSRWIYHTPNKSVKKSLLIFSIILNIGLLFYFKYTDFFIGIVNDLTAGHIRPLHLLLPIGISFYTFENLSYTIDVYRKEIKPVDNFMDYLFFLSFFPKLMMGPIVRAADFIPQISMPYRLNADDIGKGMYLIIGGLFKKIVISDFIYQNFVQYIFDDPSKHTGLECLIGVYGYALVIYCDFSGYSDMALGIARWTGFKIPPNFDSPYQSSSITEFWRRWHISLSSWLRDYLYIPLGGNRKGKGRQYVNLALTMLIGGFWHGASWNFIFWGGMHGTALAIDKVRIDWLKKSKKAITGWKASVLKVGGVLLTFHFVCFCWIFFKAASFHDAWSLIHQVVYDFQPGIWLELYNGYTAVFWVMVLGFVLHFMPAKAEFSVERILGRIPVAGSVAIMVAFIWLLAQVKSTQPMIPIYFQF